MRLALAVGLGWALAALSTSVAGRAQTPPTGAPAASEFPAEPSAPAEPSCVPRCRSGFLCIDGQCVSACNPPCPEGTRCNGEGECEREAAAEPYQPPRRSPPNRVRPPAPEPPARSRGAREHDGFFLRLALGFGYLASTREFRALVFTGPGPYPEPHTISHGINGVAQVGGLMLGGTLGRGVVLGGGLWGTNVFAPQVSVEVHQEGETTHATRESDLVSISLIGPFVSWYPNPKAGWHGDLALGYAYAFCGDGITLENVRAYAWGASGWGALGAFGYDFWVSEQWSLGVQARTTVMRGSGDAGDGTLTAFVPALAMTGTYH